MNINSAMLPKLLIIDDDDGITDIYAEILQNFQLQVFVAPTIEKALETLNQEQGVDLILLDYHMPPLTAHESLRKLHESPFVKDHTPPILIFTALSKSSRSQLKFDLPVAEVIEKPSEISSLVKLIGSYVTLPKD